VDLITLVCCWMVQSYAKRLIKTPLAVKLVFTCPPYRRSLFRVCLGEWRSCELCWQYLVGCLVGRKKKKSLDFLRWRATICAHRASHATYFRGYERSSPVVFALGTLLSKREAGRWYSGLIWFASTSLFV